MTNKNYRIISSMERKTSNLGKYLKLGTLVEIRKDNRIIDSEFGFSISPINLPFDRELAITIKREIYWAICNIKPEEIAWLLGEKFIS